MPGYIGRADIQIAGGAISRDAFTGNGAQQSFGPLSQTPFEEEETIVTINGVVQHDSSYAVVVDFVNFAVAPDNLDEIEVKVHSTDRRPAEGVNETNIDDGAVTKAKLSTVDVVSSNDRFARSLIPSKDITVLTATPSYNYSNANRATRENKQVFQDFAIGGALSLYTAGWGDEFEYIITSDLHDSTIILQDGGMTAHIIDGSGTETTITTGTNYILKGKCVTKIKYRTPTEIVIETTYIPSLIAVDGWCNLAGGLIMQWGDGTVAGGGSTFQTFPKPFPNACLNVNSVPLGTGPGGGQYDYWGVSGITVNGFTQYNGYDGGQSLYYQAIGY